MKSAGAISIYLFTSLLFLSLYLKKQSDTEEDVVRGWGFVLFELPETPPAFDIDSIELASIFFDIDISRVNIELSSTLEDRARIYFLGPRPKVLVGIPAFESWSILGSTLAHEIEVHAKQSIIDRWDRDKAEREAYRYEIKNAKRFQLSEEDQFSIQQTMEYYYGR